MPALQLGVPTTLSFDGTPSFARTAINVTRGWCGRDGRYITVDQDRRETSRNRYEREKDIREFFHRAQLGCGILSGLLGRFLFVGAFALFSSESESSSAGNVVICTQKIIIRQMV